jgi:Cu(I)/Ag(I) efflux system protein CusF
MKSVISISLILVFIPRGLALVGPRDHGLNMDSGALVQGNAAEPGMPMSGEVVLEVDRFADRITIRHGELYNLGMPAMTMAFRVSKPAMLNLVKPGDEVQFRAGRGQGSLILIDVETKSP